MPRSSKAAKIQHSDSEGSMQVKPAPKRQKLDIGANNDKSSDSDIIMVDASKQQNYDPNKNGKLKGRKRFNADFADLQEAVKLGLNFDSLVVKRVCAGDDEGSVEVVVEKDSSERVITVNFLISDTSEYPSSHSLFCYSPDGDLSAKIQKIVDEISEEPARSLGCTIRGFVQSVARVVSGSASRMKSQPREEVTDDEPISDGVDEFDAFDFDDDIAITPESDSVLAKIQETFIDIVATEYRPGFICLPGNDFVLSISLPVITLSKLIPPRALMAWDRRLLASSQHLTLLISGFHGLYPVLNANATYANTAQRLAVCLSFKVGLSERYKPGAEQVREVIRKHGLIANDAEDEFKMQELLAAQQIKLEWGSDQEDNLVPDSGPVVEEEVDPNRFDRFSLSSSLESLMDQSFLKLVQIRRRFGLGWAGAELLHAESEKVQMTEADVLASKLTDIAHADQEESQLSSLPYDPLFNLKDDEPFNLPLTAFCYLIRRLSLCTRYCTVCHNRLQSDYESLKPYVCDSKLCSYQYYTLNRGPSLEYEIVQNPQTVDLLVSLAFTSAGEGTMDDPLPIGMGLRVPLPEAAAAIQPTTFAAYYSNLSPAIPEVPKDLQPGSDGLIDFDDLTTEQMRSCIVELIDTLPSVMDMKKHLEQKVKVGKRKPKLQDIDHEVLPAAWSILRWCVASCTAHIEAITSPDETIKNLDSAWRQFRMTVGAPAAEAKFRGAIEAAQKDCPNVEEYPVIYAFHASPLKNWHSIIRHGLWYKTITNGRAFGNGVYLAKDGLTSVGYLTHSSRSSWSKSMISPSNCMALAEVVNLPSNFVSQNPHYVVKDTHWIMCRYLLVKGSDSTPNAFTANVSSSPDTEPTIQVSGRRKKKRVVTPYVRFDPQYKTHMGGKVIEIPDPAFQLETLLAARDADYKHEDADADDLAIFQLETKKLSVSNSQSKNYDLDDDDDYLVPVPKSSVTKIVATKLRPENDWKHDAEYVGKTLANLMLPPFQSTPLASLAIQRELKSMVKEQETACSLKDQGWYMPPELIGDNLYQWIVEMHSFDPALPIAKDMKTKKVNSIIFEIRFPPLFPNSPPFFRIITPRFLPFIHGGGGHVTGGGSICMDLLTSDGWLPSYSISAVLMQIRLAISNLEPRPARLARNWNEPYGIAESLAGFKRAAATHNWSVPEGLDHLVR